MTWIEFYPLVRHTNGWEPDVDIVETKDSLVITAELPGLKKEDVSLTLEDHTLTLKGEKSKETSGEREDCNLNERGFGKFCRSFVVTESIRPKKMKTSFKDGVLRIRIPKSRVAEEKEIKVEFK